MRRLTRRARWLRRHSTWVGPLGSASSSDRGRSIVRSNSMWDRFVNQEINLTQSYAECTQSSAEKNFMRFALTLHAGPARSAQKHFLSETLCALSATLCPVDFSSCLRQRHPARVERREQLRLRLGTQLQMWRAHVVPGGIAG